MYCFIALYCVYAVEAALLAVSNAINGAVVEGLLVALQSEVLDLKDVMPDIVEYYCNCLVKQKTKKQDVSPVVMYIRISYVFGAYNYYVHHDRLFCNWVDILSSSYGCNGH